MASVVVESAQRVRRPWYRQLYTWVFAGMAAGVIVGLVAPGFATSLEVLGDTFVGLLTMLLGPIVFCMVVSGIAAVDRLRHVGAIALRSIAYFEIVTTLALLLGLLAVNLVRPGAGLAVDPAQLQLTDEVSARVDAASEMSWSDYVLQIFPKNIVASFAEGAILQILFFAVLFGVALAVLGDRARPVARAVDRIGEVLFTIVRLVTYAAPVGVFGAMAYTVGHFGVATIGALLKLVGTFYGTSIVFVVVVLGGILLLVRLNPLHTFRYFKDEILLALGASSSEAAIPGIVAKLTRLGVDKGTAGITVSAGYSFNLDGTCIYLTLTSMFIAQALGIDLDLGRQLLLLAVMLLSSKGTAGVTGGGFVMLSTTVSATSVIPVSGVMLVFGIDRFMSECRAVVNSLGNAVAGLVIARWQGEISSSAANAIMSGRSTPPVPLTSEPEKVSGR
ncbi:cation:dicarboxylate symporter family transporter [Nonomuraea sp. NPDC003201]